jgi:phytoene dehydrogenase-like protein
VATAKIIRPNVSPEPELDAVIIGAGLAGLACARELTKAGLQVKVLEAADAPGGRIRTDVVDGFRLDRGFQVLLTEYPEAKRVLNYDALALRNFVPGALVRHGGKFHRFADPSREFRKALDFAFDPVVSLGDKWRMAKLRTESVNSKEWQFYAMQDETTRDWLRKLGFSPQMMERFFEPFFGGVFLERKLTTSARWFCWLFRMFATGFAAVPELGMEQIPAQLAARLPKGMLTCGAGVTSVEKAGKWWRVDAGSAGVFPTKQVVMAAREPEAKALMVKLREADAGPERVWNKTTTIYYGASEAPVNEAAIVLNGEGATAGPVNHLAVMNMVSPAYAPPGGNLICANVVGSAPSSDEAMGALQEDVRAQLRRWFGQQVDRWEVLAGYPIAHALPAQSTFQAPRGAQTDNGIILCGDYVTTASIQGALLSGAKAAEAVQAPAGTVGLTKW